MKELFVIKVGGNIIDDEEKLELFLKKFHAIDSPKILVHGGGKLATKLSAKLGIEIKMVDGRRITDEETLKTVTMVYCGYINKTITAKLNAWGTNALGICGADMNLIPAAKRKTGVIDYGFVGDILFEQIPPKKWNDFLAKDICPIVAPITSAADGQLLNTNADTIASGIAQAMSKLYKTTLIYCFEKEGVLRNPDDDNSVINHITPETYTALKSDGVVSEGMIPKLDNSWEAIKKGVNRVIIGNALHIDKLINSRTGTLLSRN